MRLAPLAVATSLLAVFSACNSILGNESEYNLVGGKGGTAGGTSSQSGAAGRANGGGGRSTNGPGGAGGTSEAGAGGSDDAGTTGAGGAAGASGAAGAGGAAGGEGSGCVPTGLEDCFNGRDDDCDGDTDCADSECAQPAECRPAPKGAKLGFFAAPGGTCPAGYTKIDLHQGLQASTTCKGCSCVAPTDLLCDSGIYGHGAYACPSYQFAGQLYNVFNDRCSALPGDTNLHYYSIRGTSQCTPSGTPTVDPPTWTANEVFCAIDRTGGGCGTGMACVPAPSRPLCKVDGGACGGDYATDRGTWYERFNDERTCSDCSCGLGTADCSASYIAIYSDGACGANATPLAMVSVQGDACSLSFAPRSARIIGNPVSGSGSCQPNNFLSGEATPENAHSICCSPSPSP